MTVGFLNYITCGSISGERIVVDVDSEQGLDDIIAAFGGIVSILFAILLIGALNSIRELHLAYADHYVKWTKHESNFSRFIVGRWHTQLSEEGPAWIFSRWSLPFAWPIPLSGDYFEYEVLSFPSIFRGCKYNIVNICEICEILAALLTEILFLFDEVFSSEILDRNWIFGVGRDVKRYNQYWITQNRSLSLMRICSLGSYTCFGPVVLSDISSCKDYCHFHSNRKGKKTWIVMCTESDLCLFSFFRNLSSWRGQVGIFDWIFDSYLYEKSMAYRVTENTKRTCSWRVFERAVVDIDIIDYLIIFIAFPWHMKVVLR